ncbi:MAG: phage baseplate assembly protein V [Spirochaetales bacterium]|nr:phage baseplate assembly protein V [Spirochaetales bacterium]
MAGYITSLQDIIEEFAKEYYDPRDPFARRRYEENKRKQNFSFGIVVDNQDPEGRGRIKVSLPMIAKGYISKWIWVVHPYAGQAAGVAILPDINDQVLCAFIGGSIHQPVCLGGMYTPRHRPPIADNANNNIKAIKTKSTYLVLDDTPDAPRMEASIKDGQIRVVLDTEGIHLNNDLGPINLGARKVTVSGAASRWVTDSDVKIDAGGNVSITTGSETALTCSGNATVEGSVIDLNGSTGVTAEGKQIAKENDPVAGMDLHDIKVPSNSGLKTVPAIPHPYIGKMLDALSADVNIQGSPAATEGSISEFTTPGHFPMPPGVKFKKDPDNKGEVTNGCVDSVTINGNPAAVLGSTVTTCDDAGSQDQCTILAVGTTVTFPITYPGQDPEQYRRDGGLPINVSNPAIYTPADIAYRDQPKSLTNLQWSETQIEKGTEVTLSCVTSGVRDGAGVQFSIFPDGANPETDPPVMDIRGSNEGGGAEVTWLARDLRQRRDDLPMKWFFTAWTLYCPKETSETMDVVANIKILCRDSTGDLLKDLKYYLLKNGAKDQEGTTDSDGWINIEGAIPGQKVLLDFTDYRKPDSDKRDTSELYTGDEKIRTREIGEEDFENGIETKSGKIQEIIVPTLVLRLNINPNEREHEDDTYKLYSSNYECLQTVADDKVEGDNLLDLHFVGLDKRETYSLEIDMGAEGMTYHLFRDLSVDQLQS